MFTIYTRFYEEQFESVEQAIAFYKRCIGCADGSERDYYYEVVDRLEETRSNEHELVMPDYINTRVCSYYDKAKNHLVEKVIKG